MARMNAAAMAGLGLALIGAGFGLGVLVTGGAPPTAETRIIRVEPGTTVVRRDLPPPDASASGRASAPAPSAASAADPATGLDAVRAAIAAVGVPPVPTGTGVVKGRVVKEDGQPLAGVEVTLAPEPPPGTFGKRRTSQDPEPDLETSVRESIRSTRWWREARQKTTSDAAGAFRFDAVLDANNNLSAKLRGWEIHPRGNNGWRVRPGAEVEWLATPQVEIPVEIVLPDGTAPAQAQVEYTMGNSHSGMGWNPDSPLVRLKPGVYDLSATSGDQGEWKSDPQSVTVAMDAPPPPVRFVLKGRPGIRGKVVMEGMATEGNLTVRWARIPGDQKADPALLQNVTDASYAQAQNGFAYSFQDLAPGRYVVGVSLSRQGKTLAFEEVEVAGEMAVRDLRVGALDPEDYVIVRVLGPDGGPLSGLQIRTGYQAPGRSSSGGGMFLKRADGSYFVPHQEVDLEKSETEGTWWVEAVSPTQGTKRAEYKRGRAQEVLIRFEEPGSVEMTVTGLAGTPLEGTLQASLQVAESGTNRSFNFGGNQQRLDAQGRANFAGVQPGEYQVVLTAGGGRGAMKAIARVPVSVRPGKNTLSAPAPTLYTVTVLGAEASAFLRKTDDPYWNDSRKPDAQGRIVFDGLPEGDYKIQSGKGSRDVHLPGTTEVQF